MNEIYNKWVAMWGNAVSITENKPESYSKDITLRYPAYCPFNGDKIRLTFDNYCGTDDVNITKATIMLDDKFYPVTFGSRPGITISAGENAVTDEVDITISEGQTIYVNFYLGDFSQMRSSVYVQGPLSGGRYAIGDMTETQDWDINTSRRTNVYYFLSNISIHTEEQNHAIVCFGDSITAQDWPDYLQLKCKEEGLRNVSIIRRATSGSRILRQYSCITYESYGYMGKKRFDHEVPTDGADMVIIQQGINDIIHPVGTEINPFRPMSDLPTVSELIDGLNWYIEKSREYGYKVVLGTLLPIEGWRTYADFREEMKNEFNDYMKNCKTVDGVIDFAESVCNPSNPKSFLAVCDSGDHLHPSADGYRAMADAAFGWLKKN